jgi:septum formation protein
LETKRRIILASASPRRQELLEKIGLTFMVDTGDYDEEQHFSCLSGTNLNPQEIVKAISLGKAKAVAKKYRNAIVIAADTIGVLRGRIIGKPRTAGEAREILRCLSGKSHRVITGITVIDTATHNMAARVVETRVYFKPLSPREISSYVKTGEPLDKAGAYAIQGMGSVIVEKIAGDYYNVMGLPLNALAECLNKFGVNVLGAMPQTGPRFPRPHSPSKKRPAN